MPNCIHVSLTHVLVGISMPDKQQTVSVIANEKGRNTEDHTSHTICNQSQRTWFTLWKMLEFQSHRIILSKAQFTAHVAYLNFSPFGKISCFWKWNWWPDLSRSEEFLFRIVEVWDLGVLRSACTCLTTIAANLVADSNSD